MFCQLLWRRVCFETDKSYCRVLTAFFSSFSEMFLGPAHKDFQFQPKHKSNSYEIEAEG